MEKTFIRIRSTKDIIISTSLIILGCILLELPDGEALNITGFFLLLVGCILAAVLKSGYKDTETGEKYLKKERYFQQAMNAEISSAIASEPESIDLSQEDKGNAVRVDVYFSKSAGKAYVQVFEYVPYRYEPSSKMYEYEIPKVAKLIE